jgi:hypothetical protein
VNRNHFCVPLVTAAVSALSLAGCNTPTTGGATTEFVKSCADSDLNSKSVLYFGPSNQIGPGSIWSRLGSSGGYQPQWRMQDLGVDRTVIDQGKTFECDLSKSSKLAANAGLSVVSSVANASAEAKADFSRGKVVKVTTKGAAWDTLVAGPYTAKLKAISDPTIGADIAAPNRIILRRALRLDGYRVTMDFDSAIKPDIKAKYSGKLLGKETVGDVGANLSAQWTSEDRLELTASDGVYVAGEFAQLVNGEWVATKGGPGIDDLGDTWVRTFVPKR